MNNNYAPYPKMSKYLVYACFFFLVIADFLLRSVFLALYTADGKMNRTFRKKGNCTYDVECIYI